MKKQYMQGDVLVRDTLELMLDAARTVKRRFAPIGRARDFLASEDGLVRLDAICMQLIAIGESVKNLDKLTAGRLLPRYPGVDWRRLMGMRDILSHHYFSLDVEIVFTVCQMHIPGLERELVRMLEELGPDG